MEDTRTIYKVNNITELIRETRYAIQGNLPIEYDPRIAAMIATKLQEAELLSLVLLETVTVNFTIGVD